MIYMYRKTCLKQPLKIDKTKVLKWWLNAGQKYCRSIMLQEEHSVILLTCIKVTIRLEHELFVLSTISKVSFSLINVICIPDIKCI